MIENIVSNMINQHLIDPDICIRCNNCEESCPSGAISNDGRNYVVDFEKCNQCLKCMPDCPTGAIDSWRLLRVDEVYSVAEQLNWTTLPEISDKNLKVLNDENNISTNTSGYEPNLFENNYKQNNPLLARVISNTRITSASTTSDVHHIVLAINPDEFKYVEGQSIGVIPPGRDQSGLLHKIRLYSIASKRSGEEDNFGNIALTVKKVKKLRSNEIQNGICSNYLCNLKVGEQLYVFGPLGSNFLTPNDPTSKIIMISTGTGIAPMRGIIQHRIHTNNASKESLVLFYGGRSPQELAYLSELIELQENHLDLNLAYSRLDNKKNYVQDLLLLRSNEIIEWLKSENSHFYLCGLKQMEDGVVKTLSEICDKNNMNWEDIRLNLKMQGRLHIETY